MSAKIIEELAEAKQPAGKAKRKGYSIKMSDQFNPEGDAAAPHPWEEDPFKTIVAEVASLRDEVLELRQGFPTSRGADVPRVILPELHDEDTGRIDAQKVASFMGVPLKPFAEGLGLNYKGVHRNPSASGFQEALRPVKRSLELLHEFFGPKETIRVWLNTPHPALDGATSLDTILEGKAFAVSRILENAWNGLPL
jgi:hypothetical protein